MNWFFSMLLGLIWFSALSSVFLIGKPRDPMSPTAAVFSMLYALGLTAGVLHYAK